MMCRGVLRRRLSRRAVLVSAWLILVAACTGGPDREAEQKTGELPRLTGGEVTFADLRRPLRLPRVGSGEKCPRTHGSPGSRYAPDFSSETFALGDGPVYPMFTGPHAYQPDRPHRPVRLAELIRKGDWYRVKVLWIGEPGQSGPVLVRGRQLDGAYPVRFGRGDPPGRELRLGAPGDTPSGWVNWTSTVALRGPGCYGLQIDGAGFSDVVVVAVEE